MPSLERRLGLLGGAPASQVAAVLSAALVHAASDERRAICVALLRTRRRDAIVSVLHHLHQLDDEAIDAVASEPVDLDPAVGEVLAGRWPQTTRNAVTPDRAPRRCRGAPEARRGPSRGSTTSWRVTPPRCSCR